MSRLFLLRFLVPACLLAGSAAAQQPATRRVIISPIVGPVIDKQEKVTYSLFPEYSTKEFVEASFEQALAPDSTIQLRTVLTDGRTVLRTMPLPEYFATRQRLETRARTLDKTSAASGAPTDSLGQVYRLTLRSGTVLAGTLRAARPLELEFETSKAETVIIARDQVALMQLVPASEAATALLHPNWEYVGNGTRVFFAPTARNLRAGEGYVQNIDVLVLGANIGITDNVSFGVLASALPGVGLGNQFVAITPKVSYPVNPRLHIGAGVLYARVPGFDTYSSSYGAGVAYGLAMLGSADNNLTLGLGYGFSGEGNRNNYNAERGFGKSPVAVLSGATRVSRRLSLMSENYLITSGSGGLGGLYGVRFNWPRATFGVGSFYLAPFEGGGLVRLRLSRVPRFGRAPRQHSAAVALA
jgi:hypothetical protein